MKKKRLAVLMCSAALFACGARAEGAAESCVLFTGAQQVRQKDGVFCYLFTAHVGGRWDASAITGGGYLRAVYDGPENAVYLALGSASGGTQYALVYPSEGGENPDGTRYAIFSDEAMLRAYGRNIARLDTVYVQSRVPQAVTLRRLSYFSDGGKPLEGGEREWARPHSGIAFIGDSIVQNPAVEDAHLRRIDWNGILSRTDCVNYGIGAQTTVHCAARIGDIAKIGYEKAVILCGINDLSAGHSNVKIYGNYNKMVDALKRGNPNIQIYILSVLPTSDAFFRGAQDKITGLNTVLRAYADRTENVTFVDCHSRLVGEDGYCRDGLTIDGLHPNLAGYALIADALKPYLDE